MEYTIPRLRKKKGGNVFLQIIEKYKRGQDYSFYNLIRKFRKYNNDKDEETFLYTPSNREDVLVLFCGITGFREWWKQHTQKYTDVDYYKLVVLMNRQENIIFDYNNGLFITLNDGDEHKKVSLNDFIAMNNLDRSIEPPIDQNIPIQPMRSWLTTLPTERPFFGST